MRIEKVVVNSSPLIVLFRSGQANLLSQLFREIVVPEQVYAEVLAGGANDAAKIMLPQTDWIIRKKVGDYPLCCGLEFGKRRICSIFSCHKSIRVQSTCGRSRSAQMCSCLWNSDNGHRWSSGACQATGPDRFRERPVGTAQGCWIILV